MPSDTFWHFALTGAPLVVGHFVTHVLGSLFSAKYRSLSEKQKNLNWVLEWMSIPACAAIFAGYAHSINRLAWTPADRWAGTSGPIGQYTLALHINLSIYESIVYILYGKPAIFLGHHAIVLLNFVQVYYTGHLEFYAAWDGLTEITNLPLCTMTLMNRLEMKSHPLFVPNGVLLWLTFVIFRIVSLPGWLALYASDMIKHPELVAAAPFPLHPLTIPSTFAIWALSMTWFVRITRGMLKTLGLLGDSKGKKAGKKAK